MYQTMLDFQTLLFETLSHDFADRIFLRNKKATHRTDPFTLQVYPSCVSYHWMSRVTYLGCIVFFMVHVGWILG